MRLSCTALSCGSVWPVRHFSCRKPSKKSPAGQTQMDPLCRGRSIQRLYARGATPLRVLIIGRTDPDSYQRSPLLSIKKSLKFREIPWPYSSCIKNFPFVFLLYSENLVCIQETFWVQDLRQSARSFFRNSNKFPATDVCLHVMSYSA